MDRIRHLNASFALATFTVKKKKTISDKGAYTFIARGQMYQQINKEISPQLLSIIEKEFREKKNRGFNPM